MSGSGRILISGASGLIGRSLSAALREDGYEIVRLVRARPGEASGGVFWDPQRDELDPARLEGADAVVHLAGEGIADGRWSRAKKRRLLESRTRGTRLVAETLARLEKPPPVLVSASAIGYYGDRGDEPLDESSAPGRGFLSEVCVAWEAATAAARSAGVRVVSLRLGLVLAREGGALPRLALPFRFGCGGRLGDGRQFVSWIALADVLGAILHALRTDTLRGPVNAVAPSPVTNAELARTLGRSLRRPALLPVPAFALRALAGEMADALLLSSACVYPRALEASGYDFVHPDLERALRVALERRPRGD